jgi:chromosome segregation ATPase
MSDSKKIDHIQEKIDSMAETLSNVDKEIALQKAAFEAHTKQYESMYGELKRMNDLLQENTGSLREHMSNNILLKEMIAKMDERLSPLEIQYIEKKAVKTWATHKVKLIAKLGAALAGFAGAWVYVKPWLEHLFK